MTTAGRRLLAAMITLILALAALPAQAAVGDLRSALLQKSDAPPGFAQPHYAVYTHYAKKLKVTTTTKGMGKGQSSCDQPSYYKSDGWKEGLIEGFDSSGIFLDLELCGTLFATPSGAQKAYRTSARIFQKSIGTGKSKTKLLVLPKVGDESLAVGGTQSGIGIYAMIFRHQNALINLIYVGPGSFTPSRFGNLAALTNSRLR